MWTSPSGQALSRGLGLEAVALDGLSEDGTEKASVRHGAERGLNQASADYDNNSTEQYIDAKIMEIFGFPRIDLIVPQVELQVFQPQEHMLRVMRRRTRQNSGVWVKEPIRCVASRVRWETKVNLDHVLFLRCSWKSTYACLVVATGNELILYATSASFSRGVIASRASTSIPQSHGSSLGCIMAQ